MTLSAISEARLREVHPELARRVRQLDLLIPEIDIQVTQGLRTWAEQDALYAQGRTAPGKIVTNARGGYSMHNFGLAADLVPEDVTPGQPDWDATHPAWRKMLAAGAAVGLAEGAQWRTFPDMPHFYLAELPANPTDAMREAFLVEGRVDDVWREVASVILSSPGTPGTTEDA